MSKKYTYQIILNDAAKTGQPILYKFGMTSDIQLYIYPQKAIIEFEMGSKKTVDDLLSFKVKIFRDAFRKVYLLHALKYDCGLEVKKMQIMADKEVKLFDAETPNFPFLFSMIEPRPLGVGNQWEAAMDRILELPKTKQDTDHRFSALFSLLASSSRSYRIDRFTNLWTAMNAYGNYIAECYESSLKKKYVLDNMDYLGSKKKTDRVNRSLFLYRQDVKITKVLSLLVHSPLEFIDTTELWKDYYGVQNALSKISASDYSELYEEARKALSPDYELQEKYKELEACANRFHRPLFVFLLIEYPYHLRCKFLHGSFSTILFSAYNDYEIACLGVVNYFLNRYLNEVLPDLFHPDYWTEARFEEIQEFLKMIVGQEYETVLSFLQPSHDNSKGGETK